MRSSGAVLASAVTRPDVGACGTSRKSIRARAVDGPRLLKAIGLYVGRDHDADMAWWTDKEYKRHYRESGVP